jgi:hypothetical protein
MLKLWEEHFPLTLQEKVEIVSQSYVDMWREYHIGLDFPPTAHPGREMLTGSVFRIVIVVFLVLGGWELISSTH